MEVVLGPPGEGQGQAEAVGLTVVVEAVVEVVGTIQSWAGRM